MKKSKFSVLALLMAIMLMLAACNGGSKETSNEKEGGSGDSSGSKVLNVNNSSEPGSLHPANAQGTHESWILEHTFEGLTKKTEEGKIVPGSAESWEISEDGLTWTFKLKDGLKWSNGDPLTANDFEYAWKYALKPETAADYAYQLYYLKGGEAYNSKKGKEEDVGVKATDEHTLVVTLEQPTPYFLDLTSFYTFYPINKKVQEENPKWALDAKTHVSNGPFKLTEWKHKESLKIEKNENYYDKDKIKLDAVNFALIEDENTAWQMYQSGELDLAYPLPVDIQGQMVNSDDKEFKMGKELAVYYYNFNTEVKPFNNAKVRKALSMAIERQKITENVAQGGQKPAFGVVPPGIPDASGDFQENTGNLFKEDVKEAKKLLKEGLAEEGMKELPEFSILYNTLDSHKKIAEAVQGMWRDNLGVEVTLENAEFQVKLDREKAGDFEISRAGWVGDYVDPMTFMLWETDGAYNDAGWSNKEYDNLLKEAKSTMDPKERMDALHKAEKVMIDEMPILPVYFYTKPYMVKSNVTGVYAPINAYPNFIYADKK
ncbi:peptide ABC transporter substrate-binding protein [Peribacillus frigoritolerans]|uniref:peptide ABC transporter substrate-binding protein n=1 Tax=Peribacillus frigoritolerans TaxID=450367 RepID=UPI001FCEBCD6|nr:peptide ABC transporter substrate-binding protein [Peribacillus frigoritolerans]MED3790438.1 peptide ABC transporter substrate-binding protein [Peribacillus frigoritolerans]MED3833661.1 peptide ABC transporter substrate-binding protein [Peribacillus frigoritolerans]MED3847287.1 peptide ABC transporter substrate-binding protein [Peribacillus frigoritolerans]WVN08677.1 peptide ABC transporter substrate-binding protein [Peribacillus frigoritolerans]